MQGDYQVKPKKEIKDGKYHINPVRWVEISKKKKRKPENYEYQQLLIE